MDKNTKMGMTKEGAAYEQMMEQARQQDADLENDYQEYLEHMAFRDPKESTDIEDVRAVGATGSARMYRVVVERCSWNRKDNRFEPCEMEVVHEGDDLSLAKTALAHAWESREAIAQTAMSPVFISLQTTPPVNDDGPGGEAWEVFINPASDERWRKYYGGQDCSLWFALWTRNISMDPCYGPEHTLGRLGIVGDEMSGSRGFGEWELRYMENLPGAVYASALVPTSRQMVAIIADNPKLSSRQDILGALACSTDVSVQGVRNVGPSSTTITAVLPNGSSVTINAADPDESVYYAIWTDATTRSKKIARIRIPDELH